MKNHEPRRLGASPSCVAKRGRQEGHYAAVAVQQGEELSGWDACTDLWYAVIKRALEDIVLLRKLRGKTALKKYEFRELRDILEDCPHAFFEGVWFEEICVCLGINPDAIRSRLAEVLQGENGFQCQ